MAETLDNFVSTSKSQIEEVYVESMPDKCRNCFSVRRSAAAYAIRLASGALSALEFAVAMTKYSSNINSECLTGVEASVNPEESPICHYGEVK